MISTKFAQKKLAGPLVIDTKKNPGNSVMAVSHLQGYFVVPGSENNPPIRFHRMRNPPTLDLPGDLRLHEEVQYHLYSMLKRSWSSGAKTRILKLTRLSQRWKLVRRLTKRERAQWAPNAKEIFSSSML